MNTPLTPDHPQYYPTPDVEVYHTGNGGEYLIVMPNGDRTCAYQGMCMYEEPKVQGKIAYEFALDLWRKQNYEKWTREMALERWASTIAKLKKWSETAKHQDNKKLFSNFMDFINRHFPCTNSG